MKIISLNVNGFRGMTKQGEHVPNSKLVENLNALKNYIDDINIDDKSIIVLQEIPHEIADKTVRPWIWEEEDLFCKFKELFETDYMIFYPRYLIHSIQCTVALGRKNTLWHYPSKSIIQYDSNHRYGNKLIEIAMEDVCLVGVHINPCDEMWNLLLNSLKMNDVSFLVGDFNAYEKRGLMQCKPKQLRDLGYNSVIPCNVITDFRDKSSLDNLYINTKLNLNEGMKVAVQKTESFITDHAICIFEI